MARSNVSYSELMQVLQKTDAPFGNQLAMQQAQPFMPEAVAGQVTYQNPAIPKLQQQYKDVQGQYRGQLDQIAAMDAKLSGVYGNPSSNLYIENPMARQSAISGAARTGYQEAGDTAEKSQRIAKQVEQEQVAQEREIGRQIDEAIRLYKDLTTAQGREERAAKKGSGRSSSGGSKASTKRYSTEQKKLGYDLTDQAGIVDESARDLFLAAPTQFQRMWIRHIFEGQSQGGNLIPKNGFSAKDVEENLKSYNENFKPKTQAPKKAEGDKQREKFDALNKALGL